MGYVYMALATLLFSSMEIALKMVSGHFNTVQINFTRFCIGGLLLLPLAWRILRQRGLRLDLAALRSFAALGFLCCVVSMTFFQLAVERANASVVAVLFSCNPVFVFLFSFLILRIAILPKQIAALLIVCTGMIVIINPLHTFISPSGIVFSLLAMITFALYAVLGTRQCEKYSATVVTCGGFLFGSLEMLLLVGLSHIGPLADLLVALNLPMFARIPLFSGYTPDIIPAMLFICVGVTGVGFASYFMAMQLTSPLKASLVFFLKPALAPVLAFFILSEPIPLNMKIGIALIIAGSLVSLLPSLNPELPKLPKE